MFFVQVQFNDLDSSQEHTKPCTHWLVKVQATAHAQQPSGHLYVHAVWEPGSKTVCKCQKWQLSNWVTAFWVYRMKQDSALGCLNKYLIKGQVIPSWQFTGSWTWSQI